MAWRGVHMSEAARLAISHGQLVVSGANGDVTLAPEDLAFLIIDTPKVTISSAAISTLMDNGVAIIQCDGKHLPSGLMLPFHSHYRQGDIARRQIAATTPFKKRCWQTIVRAKIKNQATALDALGRSGASELQNMMGRVKSGDPDNIEAQAARCYWERLFQDFKRKDDGDRRNGLLNYGYAVIRSCVARALVGCGFLPAFGLHHDSATNAFNLVDDIIEPFRPITDEIAAKRFAETPEEKALTLDDRRQMVSAANASVLLGQETMTVLACCERVAQSLARALTAGDPGQLELPQFRFTLRSTS